MNDGSVEEFIIYKCVFADVAFDEKRVDEVEQFFEGQGDQESQIDVVKSYVEDVDEVYEVEE